MKEHHPLFYKQRFFVCFLYTILLFASLHPLQTAAQNRISIELPLLINNSYIGDITTYINPSSHDTTDTHIDVNRLEELFRPFSSENQRTTWFETKDGEINASIRQLQEKGLKIHYDPALLNISAKIIKDGISHISLLNREIPNPENYEPLAKFASGLNIELLPSYIHQGDEQGLAPFEADFSGFTSINGFHGWALTYSGDYREDSANQFSRGNVTAVHNNFEHAIRYAIGDVRPTVSRFQSSIDIAGLSIERDYSRINPFRNLRPNGRNTFTLERDAKVSFLVNGTTVLIRDLVAGSYAVSDFPLITGNNDVTVIIDDGSSKKEISRFSTYVDTSLLSKGFTNFGLNIGFPVDPESNFRSRKYQNDPVALTFWEKGITDNLTLGFQLEIAEHHRLLASSAIFGNSYGFWGIELSSSNQDDIGTGYSGLIQYEVEPKSSFLGWASRLNLQAQYKSGEFISLGQRVISDEQSNLNGRLRLQKDRSSINLSSSFRKTGNRETKTVSINLSQSYRSFSVSLNTQYSKQNDTDSDTRFSINVSKKIGKHRHKNPHRLRARYNSKDHNSSLELRNTSGSNVDDFSYNIALQDSDLNNNIDVDMSYIQSRYEVDLNHQTGKSKSANNRTQSQTNVNLATSLGFADGNFSFGRPFDDGFIILKRHKTLANKKVAISKNAFSGSTVSSTHYLDTVLIPLNSTYRSSNFLVDVEDLPVGYDTDGGEIKVFPNQTPAYVYQLGSNASNIIIGRLHNKQDEPLRLVSGKLLSRNVDQALIIDFFTNKTGRFVAEKIAEGTYDIQLSGSTVNVGSLTVKQAKEPGLIEVGKIIIEAP